MRLFRFLAAALLVLSPSVASAQLCCGHSHHRGVAIAYAAPASYSVPYTVAAPVSYAPAAVQITSLQFAMPVSYAPAAYAPAAYAPAAYAPAGYAPAGYAPAGYAPAGYAPAGYSPSYMPPAYPPPAYAPPGAGTTAAPPANGDCCQRLEKAIADLRAVVYQHTETLADHERRLQMLNQKAKLPPPRSDDE